MLILLLFALGASLAGGCIAAAGLRTQQQRWNLVSTGIFGSLFGGLYLPRAMPGVLPFDAPQIVAPLILATLTSALLISMLVLLRRIF